MSRPSGTTSALLLIAFLALLATSARLNAQAPEAPTPQPPPASPSSPPGKPPAGKVLFSRSIPALTDTSTTPDADAPAQPPPAPVQEAPAGPPDTLPNPAVTQAERASIRIASCDLDVHLIPAAAREVTHATLTVRNVTSTPLTRIPLQISSTLRWQTIASSSASGLKRLAFTQSPIATDTDHTGYAEEAVIALPEPVAPGATVILSVFYAGDIPQGAARLELLGTAPELAAHADWDQITPTTDQSATALRGFGNVLWYPVAAPTALLGDGNRLVDLIGRQRLDESSASIRLRLTVEYVGDPPVAAIFDSVLQPFTAIPDEQDQLVADTHGLASADFPRRTLGFRSPSLFLTGQQPTPADDQALSVITPRPEAVRLYAEAASMVQPLLSDWFGVTPITPLILLDHAGEPFEDAALLATPLDPSARPADLAPRLLAPLTHAWFRSAHPWISQGLAEFMNLLWTERTRGREAALAQLGQQDNLVALAEPDLSAALTAGQKPDPNLGQPLTEASSPVYFRAKAAAVWWQLRDIVGEDTLRQALVAYRHAESLHSAFDDDPRAMQNTLERLSGKELGWFFEDWVYHDRSLPDLSIVEVSPHLLPVRPGKNSGYLVAVEVRNEGDAVAEVPVTVRSGSLTATERLRIPARSLASTRIVFEGTPQTVQVNDGSTPELRASTHTRELTLHEQ